MGHIQEFLRHSLGKVILILYLGSAPLLGCFGRIVQEASKFLANYSLQLEASHETME